MHCEMRSRDFEFGLGDDHVNFSEVAGQAVPQAPLNYRPEKRGGATSAFGQESRSALDIGRGGAFGEPELPLADVLLVANDLLLQAKALAVSGARAEAIEAILDHVAALREGRG